MSSHKKEQDLGMLIKGSLLNAKAPKKGKAIKNKNKSGIEKNVHICSYFQEYCWSNSQGIHSKTASLYSGNKTCWASVHVQLRVYELSYTFYSF